MTTLVFLDTETTGIIRSKDKAVPDETGYMVQLAFADCSPEQFMGQNLVHLPYVHSRYYRAPKGIPMELEAMAATQLTPAFLEDVAKADFETSWRDTLRERIKTLAADPDTVFIAHNADFDRRVLARYGIDPKRWVCTMKVAKAHFDFEHYGQQYLRYRLDEYGLYHKMRFSAHDAREDVRCLALLFSLIMANVTSTATEATLDGRLASFEAISAAPQVIRRMPFGKHRGKRLDTEIPVDYLQWLLGQSDIDPDLRYNIQKQLGGTM